MKNTYSLAERNRIVEEYLPYVDQVIRRNRALMRASRLEYDDVYQQLSLRLIRAVSTYDPNKGELGTHILAQLHFELLNCKAPRRLCGKGFGSLLPRCSPTAAFYPPRRFGDGRFSAISIFLSAL